MACCPFRVVGFCSVCGLVLVWKKPEIKQHHGNIQMNINTLFSYFWRNMYGKDIASCIFFTNLVIVAVVNIIIEEVQTETEALYSVLTSVSEIPVPTNLTATVPQILWAAYRCTTVISFINI